MSNALEKKLFLMDSEVMIAQLQAAKTSVSPHCSPMATFPPRETSPSANSEEKRMFSQASCIYSRLPITQTFKGNKKKRFELSGVRVIGSSKKIAGSKEKNSFY